MKIGHYCGAKKPKGVETNMCVVIANVGSLSLRQLTWVGVVTIYKGKDKKNRSDEKDLSLYI